MEIMNYIVSEGLILIPVLYIIGMIIKRIEKIPDKYIPLILLVFGIAFALFLIGFNVTSVIQGVLLTGAAVYGNQITKQLTAENQ